ncbi:cupin domain-containing protein [Chitinophaga rhizosphaerae]|uniref:cupin domain-containing protein n=1 Tax=Chitinophaga rhizosphaerae TaxID=1864947 RepID=UPI000F80264B|nr:cupin domain-containing protein [Chitinophaga rhizosphaerae]
MVRQGSVIYNPYNQEQFTFLQTHASTGGAYLQIAAVVGPGGETACGAHRHRHPLQEEKFIVHSGSLWMEAGNTSRLYHAGDQVVIPPGTAHAWRNGSLTEPLHFTYEIAPAMQWESILETLWSLSQKGAFNRRGIPCFLQLAATLHRYPDHCYMAGVPVTLQKWAFRLLAVLAKWLGYRPFHKYRGVGGL